jgi:hypothetical protein
MKQRVFGYYRTLGPELIAEAGPAAEGFEAVFPYDATRGDANWLAFNERFEARFHDKPEQFASLAYDAMNVLLDSICKAGLNRARIHDALANVESYNGVTGRMAFDPNQKNVASMFLGTVRNGSITYRPAAMEKVPPPSQLAAIVTPAGNGSPQKPYAVVGEDGVSYNGPSHDDIRGPLRVVLFGPDAARVAAEAAMHATMGQAMGQGADVWQLVPVASNQSWGTASTQLVKALMEDHAVAVIALDRDAAHLAEQLALKAFVPVLALSNDKNLTATNVPWIFSLPAGTTADAAMRTLMAAEHRSGPNAERLRDMLASGADLGGLSFAATGEPQTR